MDLWRMQSNPVKQDLLSLGSSIVGLALVIGFRHFSTAGSNDKAGFLLGVLLLIIGIAGFLAGGKQTVVIDPDRRSITVEDANRLGTKKSSIQFADITGVGIGYLGKRSNFVNWYYLQLELRSGEMYSLFPPGRFFEGGSDRSAVEGWKRRLQQYLA